MKTERIIPGAVYMAVIKGQEVRVLVDMVRLDNVLGKDIDTDRGIIISTEKVVAGPLKFGTKLPNDK